MAQNDAYFASLTGPEFGREVLARCDAFYQHPIVQGVLWQMARAWRYYYGYADDWTHGTSTVSRGGAQGELAFMRVNTSRRVAVASTSQVTSRQVTWKPLAEKFDSKSLRSLERAEQLLQHVWRWMSVRKHMELAAEAARVLSEGYVHVPWNSAGGEPVDALDGQTFYTGAPSFTNPFGWEVIRDPTKTHWLRSQWIVVVDRANRWDLMADPRYADQREAIKNAPSQVPVAWFNIGLLSVASTWDDDDIPILYFYHLPSRAMPVGRQAKLLVDGTELGDGTIEPLTGGIWPLVRVTPAEKEATPFGYTEFFDALAAQQIIDHLHSAAATNYGAFARQIIAMKKGETLDVQALTDLAIAWYEEAKPEGINLTAMAQGWLQYLLQLEGEIQQTMGQNNVTLGQSPGDRAPASLGALLSAQSAQQATSFMGSFEDALKMLGQIVIEQTRENTTNEFPFQIGVMVDGRMRKSSVGPDDLASVRGVDVDLENDTPATRVQRAEMLAQIPDPAHRAEIIEVMDTGSLKPVTEASEAQYARIEFENEKLARGEIPDVNPADDDLFHGIGHQKPMMDGPARNDPAALRATRIHMAMHYQQEYGTVTSVPADPSNPASPQNDQFCRDIAADPDYPIRMRRLLGKPPPLPTLAGPPTPGASTPAAPPRPGASTQTKTPRGPSPGASPNALPPLPVVAGTNQQVTPGSDGGVPKPPIQ